jgi:hypothetical protein
MFNYNAMILSFDIQGAASQPNATHWFVCTLFLQIFSLSFSAHFAFVPFVSRS